MPPSQLRETVFESLFGTVSKIGHFLSLHWRLSWLSCINEYLTIDSGGNVSDLVLARNCCLARMLPGEAELVSEWTGQPGRAKSVKSFERSNGLDTAFTVFTIATYFPFAPSLPRSLAPSHPSSLSSVLPRLLLQGAAPCPLFVTPCPFEKAEMTPCPFD